MARSLHPLANSSAVTRGSAAVVVFALVTLAACVPGGALTTGSTSPTATASFTPENTLPPDKQADADRIAAALASASAANASLGITKDADSGSPKPGPTADQTTLEPHVPAGAGTIIESSDPAPGVNAPITNRWFASLGTGGFVSVFAGRDATDESQGLVLVTYGMPGDVQRFDAPGAHGALDIIGAVDDVLSLRAADGTTISFDVSTLSFR